MGPTTRMAFLPPLNEGELDLLVAYSFDDEEEITQAIVNAFLAADVDVFEEPTQLVDWVNADVFEDLEWSDDRLLYLCTRIWDYQVVVTPKEVRIYVPPTLVAERRGPPQV